MALRNQPYLPLYVQDFLTDEKLIECSAQATGVYIRIMCVMHKSEKYGTILLKQKDKQNPKQVLNFAYKLAKFLPYQTDVITGGLQELLDAEVLKIDGDYLVQKRMVKDNEISEIRAKAGSKGGKNSRQKERNFASTFAKAKSQAKHQANSENEIEYENEIVNDKEKGVKGEKQKLQKVELPFSSDNFKDAWQDWKEYKRKEHKFRFAAEKSEKASLTSLFNLAHGNEQSAIKIIHKSIANGWKGFYELTQNGKSNEPISKIEQLQGTFERVSEMLKTS